MAWPTVADVVNGAGKGLGLFTATVADPLGSSDANILQLVQLVTDLGQDLSRDWSWSHLQKEHTFNTADGTASYALPADFIRFVDQTAWNRTTDLPLLGPVNAQQWQALKGRATSVTSPATFRIFGDLFYIYSTPTATEAIHYEYGSSYWVDAGGGTVGDAVAPSVAASSLLFDSRLLVEGLRMYWKRAKGMGFDPVAFDVLVSKAKGRDGAAPVLSLTGSNGIKLIDETNLPVTGWGA